MKITASKCAAPVKSSPLVNLIKGKPVLAIFEITLRCNSACGYCDLPLNEGRYELSREEIKHVFADLYQSGVRHLFIQGGEPLLRQDLPDILEDLAGPWLRSVIGHQWNAPDVGIGCSICQTVAVHFCQP